MGPSPVRQGAYIPVNGGKRGGGTTESGVLLVCFVVDEVRVRTMEKAGGSEARDSGGGMIVRDKKGTKITNPLPGKKVRFFPAACDEEEVARAAQPLAAEVESEDDEGCGQTSLGHWREGRGPVGQGNSEREWPGSSHILGHRHCLRCLQKKIEATGIAC